jgi:hypothetical protein
MVTSLQRCEMLFSVVSSALCDAMALRGVTGVTLVGYTTRLLHFTDRAVGLDRERHTEGKLQ